MKIKSNLSPFFLLLLLISICILSFQIFSLEAKNRVLKTDLTELNDIKYGLFNVDIWKEKIATIISTKVDELEITDKNREENRVKIIKLLENIVSNFETDYKERNRKNAVFGISLKNIGADVFDIFKDIKTDIPKITDEILGFLEEEENRDQIKAYILSNLENYRNETFQKVDYSEYRRIIDHYTALSSENAKEIIGAQKKVLEKEIVFRGYSMTILFLLLFLALLFLKNKTKIDILLYCLIAMTFLIMGISLPMIDIDARIKLMEFNLLGENISFSDQVLYFKSKSILEVANTMLYQNEINIFLVGLLVLLFSVLFPVFKMISTLLLLFRNSLKSNIIINFMVFKSGKWSMADVMVVAIFMSYIGFTGIISNQLSELENISSSLRILTSNESDLQNGFFFFGGFVILGIGISQIIAARLKIKNA